MIAQSWWIGSELARRNNLELYEMHPGGGMYDNLALVRRTSHGSFEALVSLNRHGSISGPEGRRPTSWSEVFAAQDPHAVVHQIEASAGLGPSSRPSTTRRALAYRVIAHVLGSVVDDRHRWDARMGFLDTSNEDGCAPLPALERQFPGAVRHAERLPRSMPFGEPWRHLWILLRDSAPVAVISDDARVFSSHVEESVDLMHLYTAAQRRLRPVVDRALGDLLP